ncbi:MAG: DUF1698 domain-containing protein [Geobacter sp.]|nr:DUF1698 domain-containing protein [Geobacter sp.]
MSWRQFRNIRSYPYNWQYPVITEQYAYLKVLELLPASPNVEYIAFPWATLIDCLVHKKNDKSDHLLDILRKCPPKTSARRITVSQHIFTFEYAYIFEMAGITDIFCPHATVDILDVNNICIHPFPLFPVQCLHNPNSEKPIHERKYLYSFIGAYDQYYLTKSRQWIANLPKTADAVVDVTREWHFHADVYEKQIFGMGTEPAKQYKLDTRADNYRTMLQDTVFSLCPSGSGPNSIRLWESLGFGCIPVVISDNLRLPGSLSDWHTAAVFVPETEKAITELPDLLCAKLTDKEFLQSYAKAGKRLWQKYGLDYFIHDVVEFTNTFPPQKSRLIAGVNWFHRIDLGNGIVTPGRDDSEKKLQQVGMPESLVGKTVLDIGAWDGFFSFTAEKLGAEKVVSVDIATQAGFKVAKDILNSQAIPIEIDVMEITPEKIGTFDLVLCLGVLYHLKHPLMALERIYSVTADQLILETYVDMLDCDRPAMAFYPDRELNGDPSNWCGPNPEMVLAMLKTVGFSKAEMYSNTLTGGYAANRAVFHAWR